MDATPTKKPKPQPDLVAKVTARADDILKPEAKALRDKERLARRQQQRLAGVAKMALVDESAKAAPAKKGEPPELDPTVLASITKALAHKYQVPDKLASEAVMKAYAGIQEDASRHALSQEVRALNGVRATASATPMPAVPVYDAIEDSASDTLAANTKRRTGLRPAGM